MQYSSIKKTKEYPWKYLSDDIGLGERWMMSSGSRARRTIGSSLSDNWSMELDYNEVDLAVTWPWLFNHKYRYDTKDEKLRNVKSDHW